MTKIDFSERLILDGGMGSMFLSKNLFGQPELLNLSNAEAVTEIHREYVLSGADVVYTNTFGANRFKYNNLGEIIDAAIQNAKAANSRFVALDIGPLGKIVGDGGISFDEAYDAFKEIVLLAKDRTDYIAIETMTNLTEARAAVLAAKENSSLPVTVTMSFDKGGRTFFGVDAAAFATVMDSLGVDALGANCSVGPNEMADIAKTFLASTDLPVIIKPNAGMPKSVNGKTVYDIDENEFASAMEKIANSGVSILGGCCGTTPKHIELLSKLNCVKRKFIEIPTTICSAYKTLKLNRHIVCGERINPTGKKKVQAALRENNFDFLTSEGIKQERQGADLLDVNVGVSGIDEAHAMTTMLNRLSAVTTLPLQIDTSKPEVLEKALRLYDGRAIVNSVDASEEKMKAVLPLVKKYGAVVIGLTMDENGIPSTVDGRLKLADKIINTALNYGIMKDRIIIDALTLSEASTFGAAKVTADTVTALTKKGIKTALGVSNVSFGMPNREIINASFYEMTKAAGLTLGIVNPSMIGLSGNKFAVNFLLRKENAATEYIENVASVTTPTADETASLFDLIVTGQADAAKAKTEVLICNGEGMSLAKKEVIPALEEIGKLYETGKVFLPQLLASSEAAKAAFDVIESRQGGSSVSNGNVFLIATVKGDIHDIGKNIVKSLVKNYGYTVIDLGRDVDYDEVLKAVEKYYPCSLGLSALMTTTAENMATTIKLVREKFDLPILVGGAVITQEYADMIGGIYCKDAQATVNALNKIYNRN